MAQQLDPDAEPTPVSEDGAHGEAEAATPETEDVTSQADTPAEADSEGKGRRWWILILLAIFVELWVYGRRAEIRVCVAKQGVHDFALVGTEPNDKTRWKIPRCESRVNLGLRSNYDLLDEDAAKHACRGATLLRLRLRLRGEGPNCIAGKDGWSKQIETGYMWPWDSRYYSHLFWFLGSDK